METGVEVGRSRLRCTETPANFVVAPKPRPESWARRRIITAIQNRLQDLLTMPPLDTNGDVAEVADLKLTDLESGKVIEIEAKTDV